MHFACIFLDVGVADVMGGCKLCRWFLRKAVVLVIDEQRYA